MSKWAEAFNALPYEIRHIGAMCEAEMRINQLKMEKDRLKRAYERSLSEINGHIKNLEDYLRDEGTK